jgi:[LSU ribosomal protein L3P]-glutamine N5-methyltransferase (EC 2.1.1.-)
VITSRLRTLRDHIRWAVSRFHEHELFFGHGADNAWDEARLLVLGAVHLPWEIADSYLDCQLEDDERVRLQHLLKRRIEDRVPTAYLLGEAWFCGMSFIVDERVLVPRSPIGELIEKRFEPWLGAEPARILDLCTGSGCIGIVAAEVFPEAEVVLADLSFDALEVANQNIERHGLDERVFTVQGDGFRRPAGAAFRPDPVQPAVCRRRGLRRHAGRISPRAGNGPGLRQRRPGPGAADAGRGGRPPDRERFADR